MKKLIFFFAAVLMMAGFTSRVMAQTSTTQAHAEIISAVAITNLLPLEFSGISNPGVTGSVITMDTSGTRSLVSGPAVLLTTAILPTGARYWVTGVTGTLYYINVPTSFTITQVPAPHSNMTVDVFTVSNGSWSRTLNSSGTDEFRLGANLNIGAGNGPGTYNGTFNVTISY